MSEKLWYFAAGWCVLLLYMGIVKFYRRIKKLYIVSKRVGGIKPFRLKSYNEMSRDVYRGGLYLENRHIPSYIGIEYNQEKKMMVYYDMLKNQREEFPPIDFDQKLRVLLEVGFECYRGEALKKMLSMGYRILLTGGYELG